MNIAYLIPYSHPYDGIADYATEMARQLDPFAQITLVQVVPDHDSQHNGLPLLIRKNRLNDYVNAAHYINRHCDACLIHYLPQGFGMDHGMAILTFTAALTIPAAAIVHDLSGHPNDTLKSILQTLGHHLCNLIALSRQSADVMEHLCKIPGDKIKVIEYGVPLLQLPSRDIIRKRCGYEGKKVIFAHGMLHHHKGLDVLVEAMSMIRLKHPDAMLHFIGCTHPMEFQSGGEKYLTALLLQIRRAGLQNEIVIEHRLPSVDELNLYLAGCDIYVNPCTQELTLQSKSLAEAVVAGAAIVSTSTLYARDLLSDNRGELVPVNNPLALAETVSQLLKKNNTLEMLRKSSRDFRSLFIWSRIAGRYHKLLDEMCQTEPKISIEQRFIDVALIPHWNNAYMMMAAESHTCGDALGDAKLSQGRCRLETHAMAVMGLLKMEHHQPDAMLMSQLNHHLVQIKSMLDDNETFENLSVCDQGKIVTHQDEVIGLVFCVLAQVVVSAPWVEQRQMAAELLKISMPAVMTTTSVNGIAASLIGLCIYLEQHPDDSLTQQARELAAKLTGLFKTHASDGWYWCDDKMGNMPGMVPLALLMMRDVIKMKGNREMIEKSISFLEHLFFSEDIFFPAGTKRPLRKGRTKAEFDQSAWDAVSMTWLYDYLIKKESEPNHYKHLFACYLWFIGENSMRRNLYNYRSGGCAHLLTPGVLAVNTTYSGTLAYLLSWIMTSEAACRQYLQ
ncbi:MAG: glycosyltransferase [Marinilabiliaceae bacterium]|nr:glycosyltransferase [Marinilabiliaceae bacterium]